MCNNDFNWFLKHYDKIYQMYGHTFVTIKNEEILGHYNSLMQAIKESQTRYGAGEYIIQECNGNESGYTNYISSSEISVL